MILVHTLDYFCWISGNDTVIRYASRYNRPCTYYASVTNGNTFKYHTVHTDKNVVANADRFVLLVCHIIMDVPSVKIVH